MKMVKTISLLILCFICLNNAASGRKSSLEESSANNNTIKVGVDARVELISIVFRLAGNPEYNEGAIRSYERDIERHFAGFKDHPAVKYAKKLRETRLMSCDGPMQLAVHLDRNFKARKPLDDWPWGLGGRWKRQETQEFIDVLQQFAKETKFNEFFEEHQGLYRKGIQSTEAILEKYGMRKWLYEFFGAQKNDDLKLVLGFVNGNSNYGLRFEQGKVKEKYAVIGVYLCSRAGNPIFSSKQLETVAHEFCHSFVNPVVDKYMAQLKPAGEIIYTKVAEKLRRQGYQNWQTMMYESAVRACVADFVEDNFDRKTLDLYIGSEVKGRSFLWMKELSELLKTYENNRNKYPTFESFFPEFVKFHNDYATRLEQPKVEKVNTALRVSVDPRIELMSIVFYLAGSSEYSKSRMFDYCDAVDKYFAPHVDHPAVQFAAELVEKKGIAYDAPMSLALHIDNNFKPLKSFDDWPWGIDSRWTKSDTQRFLNLLSGFAQDTRFDRFLKQNAGTYESIVQAANKFLDKADFRQWLNEFFGTNPEAQLNLTLSPVNGRNSYKFRCENSPEKQIYYIAGISQLDSSGKPVFNDILFNHLVEYFPQAYIDPIVDRHREQLKPVAERMVDIVPEQFRQYVDGQWDIFTGECIMRTCQSCFIKKYFKERHEPFLTAGEQYGLIFIRELTNLAETYQKNRDKYPTFESFLPEFIKFFREYRNGPS